MIQELYIQNYKSHKSTRLPLKPLTILTGVNGSGKSSVIQSLLLLRQSYKRQQLSDALVLNGNFCEIGTGKDAIYQSAEEDYVQFEIKTEANEYSWKYASLESKDFLPALDKSANVYPDLNNMSLFNNNFQYLSAGRLPELEFKREDILVENERQISQKKGYGELVAQFLYQYGEKEKVNKVLLNSNSTFDDLIHQVTAWEREITPNVNVLPQKVGDSYTIHYSFDRNEALGATDPFKSENVAFGLNYALPIITALLSAKESALLLIENPEAHLHPRGQSKLAELIALAAQSGIQVIIETHSDHIINGILVACKKHESEEVKTGIDKNNVEVFYFKEKDEKHASVFDSIRILEGGKINKQPEGFFDQTEQDLTVIMGF
jgi:predicted ATPase